MKSVQRLEFMEGSKEELLPDFSDDFPYIATCAELDRYIEPVVPWHWHQTVELFYMESGSLEYTTPTGKWIFPAGSGGFVNSNVLHTSRVTQHEDSNIQFLHLFDPSLIAGGHGTRMERRYILPLISSSEIEIIPLSPDDPAQANLLKRIRQAFDLPDQSFGAEFQLREALTDIWMQLLTFAGPVTDHSNSSRRSSDRIKLMLVHIHENYAHPVSVEELAAAAHISKRACFRLFQETLHMTPGEYIKSYRLQQACRLLARSNAPITDIAGECGLGSSSYFGKTFRERFGCTPLEYRRCWHDHDRNRQ